MGQTLTIADQKRAYTLSDRATWLAGTGKIDLPIVVESDRALFNLYHVMPVNPARFPGVKINVVAAKSVCRFPRRARHTGVDRQFWPRQVRSVVVRA
jgi:tungstate transport system substrate-binding protein